MKRRITSLFVMVTMVSCTPPQPSPNPAPLSDTKDCGEACEAMRGLSCPQAEDLDPPITVDSGLIRTCEDFCLYQQTQGHHLNPSCLKTIKSCEEINTICKQ